MDANIEACFDGIEHRKLLAVLNRQIADRRVLRLIEQTLVAGVADNGRSQPTTIGVPEGAMVSLLLASVAWRVTINWWEQGE
ncbi:MAG: hypothetical protein JNN30_16505 [Rhodanobacteraceae bacterium]|nr:hypothetical protein [Rhodanobacteraceae bacterium]